MHSTPLSQTIHNICEDASAACLDEILARLEMLAQVLQEHGSQFVQHPVWRPAAFAQIRAEENRLMESPVGPYLVQRLREEIRQINALGAVNEAEKCLLGVSFVLDTLGDQLGDKDNPFEVQALLMETQQMFDDWYSGLLGLTGLRRSAD